MKINICAIAKNEDRYLIEWSNYHFNQGIDTIYLYDNNEDSHLESVLKNKICGNLVAIPINGQKCMQIETYNHYSNNFINKSDYTAFIDCDEFLTVSEKYSSFNNYMEKFLTNFPETDIIHLNWLTFNANMQKKESGEDVTKRFTTPILPLDFYNDEPWVKQPHNNHIKSIIKNDAKIKWRNCSPHTPNILSSDVITRNGDGKIISNTPFTPFTYENAFIRHYYTKSLEEWEKYKMSRTTADSNIDVYKLDLFYKFNKEMK